MRRIFFLLIIFLPGIAFAGFAERPDVNHFINQMTVKHHFAKSELVRLFNHVTVRPVVIQSVKAPLEKKPWYAYQKLFVTEWRIREGAVFWNKYQTALTRAEKTYGVPASIIVATIGVETKYGQETGEHRVIDALSSIAFSDSPRAPFFRNELEQFLLLVREHHLNPLKVMGSYAGAIGQPQFMPSSYRYYAVNFSGHGKIDLSHNEVDVIGSIANYYHQHGWQTGEPVAKETSISTQPFGFLTHNRHPDTFAASGKKTKLIELQGRYGSEYWLGYPNFDVIKRYNPSDLYAMAVYQLSYQISRLKGKSDNA
ncbi:MAG TPA: lytic murein transglycosylase B [Gammaproteobacteria bacterium]|nr:lytic murein transglycosylase B [Gammaproteobacteria bacterium]